MRRKKKETTVTESDPAVLNGEHNDQTTGVLETPTDNTRTDVPPEPVNGSRPVETFSVPCGNGAYVQASVWGKTIQYDGHEIVVYSVTVRKSYRDATTNEWRNTNSFRGSELYCVHYVLQRASEWIMAQRTTTSSETIPF